MEITKTDDVVTVVTSDEAVHEIAIQLITAVRKVSRDLQEVKEATGRAQQHITSTRAMSAMVCAINGYAQRLATSVAEKDSCIALLRALGEDADRIETLLIVASERLTTIRFA